MKSEDRDALRDQLTTDLLAKYKWLTTPDETFWIEKDGIYLPNAEHVVREEVVSRMDSDFHTDDYNNILMRLKAKTFMSWEQIEAIQANNYICLANGVLDLRYFFDVQFKSESDAVGYDYLVGEVISGI